MDKWTCLLSIFLQVFRLAEQGKAWVPLDGDVSACQKLLKEQTIQINIPALMPFVDVYGFYTIVNSNSKESKRFEYKITPHVLPELVLFVNLFRYVYNHDGKDDTQTIADVLKMMDDFKVNRIMTHSDKGEAGMAMRAHHYIMGVFNQLVSEDKALEYASAIDAELQLDKIFVKLFGDLPVVKKLLLYELHVYIKTEIWPRASIYSLCYVLNTSTAFSKNEIEDIVAIGMQNNPYVPSPFSPNDDSLEDEQNIDITQRKAVIANLLCSDKLFEKINNSIGYTEVKYKKVYGLTKNLFDALWYSMTDIQLVSHHMVGQSYIFETVEQGHTVYDKAIQDTMDALENYTDPHANDDIASQNANDMNKVENNKILLKSNISKLEKDIKSTKDKRLNLAKDIAVAENLLQKETRLLSKKKSTDADDAQTKIMHAKIQNLSNTLANLQESDEPLMNNLKSLNNRLVDLKAEFSQYEVKYRELKGEQTKNDKIAEQNKKNAKKHSAYVDIISKHRGEQILISNNALADSMMKEMNAFKGVALFKPEKDSKSYQVHIQHQYWNGCMKELQEMYKIYAITKTNLLHGSDTVDNRAVVNAKHNFVRATSDIIQYLKEQLNTLVDLELLLKKNATVQEFYNKLKLPTTKWPVLFDEFMKTRDEFKKLALKEETFLSALGKTVNDTGVDVVNWFQQMTNTVRSKTDEEIEEQLKKGIIDPLSKKRIKDLIFKFQRDIPKLPDDLKELIGETPSLDEYHNYIVADHRLVNIKILLLSCPVLLCKLQKITKDICEDPKEMRCITDYDGKTSPVRIDTAKDKDGSDTFTNQCSDNKFTSITNDNVSAVNRLITGIDNDLQNITGKREVRRIIKTVRRNTSGGVSSKRTRPSSKSRKHRSSYPAS